ncbi:hypothetical protein JOF29_001616 [Kribbella aluminosa]|uniref:Oligogalacturonide lyase n=1 Tax=Kribbella aluminosa TaxID=416017 RepID=A0ABS4UFW9_9ACTN|nr:hypothetical protein [Kribbella aluminosa]MBP2350533.1 hypothetical protein [Kribbella aluminosa]
MLAPNAHLTYPHCNGFHEGGERVALVRYDAGAVRIVSVRWNGPSRDERTLHTVPGRVGSEDEPAWFDIARDSGRLAIVVGNVLQVADPDDALEAVWSPPAGHTLDKLVSLSADGSRVAVTTAAGTVWSGWQVDVATNRATLLFQKPWYANHIHYCPHDERWIAFSKEGPALETPDRVWSWHPDTAPAGRNALDQHAISDTPGAFVAVGHERWCHHDTAALVVGYGAGEARPRGLYLTYADDRPPRLVSSGERYWHCDISRDGRYAVVDTSGPSDAPGRGWQNAGNVSDILLIDLETGGSRKLARTAATRHPWHPHPVFTPPGDAILHNHLTSAARGVAVLPL